jgi:type VI secretion system protein ImpM
MDVGFYGKLPSHGDFLRRRVTDAFVSVWDAWLQESFAASRAVLADNWLDVYLTSPAWRFACAAGVFGTEPMLGLMVPSVDRVGRYFHMAIVVPLPEGADVVASALAAEPFYTSAEHLLIETLASAHVDFSVFDHDVMDLAADLTGVPGPASGWLDAPAAEVLGDRAAPLLWQVPMRDVSQLAPVFDQLLSSRLRQLYDPLVMWWTSGSADVDPSFLIGRGLPAPESFAALLDGAWVGWRQVPATIEPEPSAASMLDDPTPPRFRSAGATDVGRTRSINQDAFLERTEVGLWAVADGLGGHEEGEVASRMVCDALADFVPDASFEQVVDAAAERIREVNGHLNRAANREFNAVRSGTTVVALLVRATRCAVLWAGDSRAYRLRAGRLDRLTRDHSLSESIGGLEGPASTAITRAVGGEELLTLDVYRDRVVVGDRFLLCSDGLTRVVPEGQIQTAMELPDIRGAVDSLIRSTLSAGAPDNVTVVVVDAYEET